MKTLLKNCQTLNGLKNILIIDDKIGYIGNELASYDKIIDIGGLWVIPGIIDPHVHVRDLQQSEKEDWNSCSNAAINGGISTIFDMPNTIPATTNLANLNLFC
mgnify:FL=1